MRDYAVVSPLFWTGATGKEIRSLGPEAQVVAMYLITSPHSNALGIYYLPLPLLAHETGLPLEGASKALTRVSEGGFCAYDTPSEVVWVYEMAKFQIGSKLSPKDNRIKWINKEYQNLPKNPFLQQFYERYKDEFHLENGRDFKAPSKPLRSQEQEQEQDIKEESKDSSSAELPKGTPADHPPSSPTFITIPLIHKNKDGTPEEFQVTQDMVNEWIDAFPAVIIEQELKKIRQWNLARPKQRKTRAGIMKHITNWLAKEQDKGGALRGTPPTAAGDNGGKVKTHDPPTQCAGCGKKTRVEWSEEHKKYLCRECYTGGMSPEDIAYRMGAIVNKAFGRRI